MKKRILFLSIALVSLTAFSYAADAPTVSKNVIHTFNQQFANARDIQWQTKSQFVKAQFSINNMVLFAYFNNSGELIALTRFISTNQLPLEKMTSLKNEFKGYWISDLFEIESGDGTAYYATMETADQILVVKSEGNGGWEIYQRIKKDNAE